LGEQVLEVVLRDENSFHIRFLSRGVIIGVVICAKTDSPCHYGESFLRLQGFQVVRRCGGRFIRTDFLADAIAMSVRRTTPRKMSGAAAMVFPFGGADVIIGAVFYASLLRKE
jgi:hypothetical protein